MSARANRQIRDSHHPSPESPSSPATKPAGCAPVLARLTWMLGGNVVLFLLAFSIMKRGTLSVLDGFFWGTVIGLLAVRYIDISKLHGTTADGEPASFRHWLRYAVTIVTVAAALWGVSHSAWGRALAP